MPSFYPLRWSFRVSLVILLESAAIYDKACKIDARHRHVIETQIVQSEGGFKTDTWSAVARVHWMDWSNTPCSAKRPLTICKAGLLSRKFISRKIGSCFAQLKISKKRKRQISSIFLASTFPCDHVNGWLSLTVPKNFYYK